MPRSEVDHLVVQEEHKCHDDQREHLCLRLVFQPNERRKDGVFERAHHPIDAHHEAKQEREYARLLQIFGWHFAVEGNGQTLETAA